MFGNKCEISKLLLLPFVILVLLLTSKYSVPLITFNERHFSLCHISTVIIFKQCLYLKYIHYINTSDVWKTEKSPLQKIFSFVTIKKILEFNLGIWIPTTLVKWTLLQGTLKPINEIKMLGMKLLSVYG